MSQKITPFLWFDTQAEEAANLYVSIFKKSKILGVMKAPEGTPNPPGSVLTVGFELDGQPFTALNGGPAFTFNESVSFVIHCKDQEEVDYYWGKFISTGGTESQCGWLKDKYGVSWQIVPDGMFKYLGGSDAAGSKRAMAAMMQMKKLDLEAMRKTYEGK